MAKSAPWRWAASAIRRRASSASVSPVANPTCETTTHAVRSVTASHTASTSTNPSAPAATSTGRTSRSPAHRWTEWRTDGNSASVRTTSSRAAPPRPANGSSQDRRHWTVQCTLGCKMHVPGAAPRSGAIQRSPSASGSDHHPTALPTSQRSGTRFQASTPRSAQSSQNACIIAGTVAGMSPCVNARSSTAGGAGTAKRSRRSSIGRGAREDPKGGVATAASETPRPSGRRRGRSHPL